MKKILLITIMLFTTWVSYADTVYENIAGRNYIDLMPQMERKLRVFVVDGMVFLQVQIFCPDLANSVMVLCSEGQEIATGQTKEEYNKSVDEYADKVTEEITTIKDGVVQDKVK